MHFNRTLAALLAAGTLAAGLAFAAPAAAQLACPQDDAEGNPTIHAQHIFCGEINRRGKATGFHSRPGGVNPASISGTGTPTPVGPEGIYVIRNFQITQNGRTSTKNLSTMFPDHCTQDQVLAAIRNAANTGKRNNTSFTGSSGESCKAGGKSFQITGFLSQDGEIITGYPNYQ